MKTKKVILFCCFCCFWGGWSYPLSPLTNQGMTIELTVGAVLLMITLIVSQAVLLWMFVRYIKGLTERVFDLNDKILSLNDELIKQRVTEVMAMPVPPDMSFAQPAPEDGEEWKANVGKHDETEDLPFEVESKIITHAPTDGNLTFSPETIVGAEAKVAKCQWACAKQNDNVTTFYFESMVDAHKVFFRIGNGGG